MAERCTLALLGFSLTRAALQIASPRASCQERTAALYELEVSLKDELCDAPAIAGARKRMRSQGGWAEGESTRHSETALLLHV